VSAIHVRTLVAALERPSTMSALQRKTGYPVGKLLLYITEARASGIRITAVARGLNMTREPTYFYIEEDHGNT
jgi:hypothetical protein